MRGTTAHRRWPLGTSAVVAVLTLASSAAGCRSFERPQTLTLANAESQKEFARGLVLHYGFYADQALAAFERAALADPADPLPRWAIALTLGPSTNDPDMSKRMARASQEAQRALTLANGRTGLVSELVKALAVRYSSAAAAADAGALNRAYARAMEGVAFRYPLNDDVATLYAESLAIAAPRRWWTPDGSPNEDVARGIAALEPVLRRSANHVGANHYWVHFIEGTRQPERAMLSAERLESLVPDVGHLLHMPSHIHMRTGNYAAAVAANQKAMAADGGQEPVHLHDGVESMLAGHTREYLSAAASITGQSAIALRVDGSLFPLLRFGRWSEVLAYPMVEGGVGELEWRIAQVVALAETGRVAEARNQRIAVTAAAQRLGSEATWWGDPLAAFLAMAGAEMDARIAWASGEREAAIERWRQAASAQDRLTRAEAVMSWYHSVRESLGSALYQMGRYDEAEAVFRDDVRVLANNPRSLFGLWSALVAQQRASDAADVKRQFDEAWRNADVKLSMDSL